MAILTFMQIERAISAAWTVAGAFAFVACGSPASLAGAIDAANALEGGDTSVASGSDAGASPSDAGNSTEAPSSPEASASDASLAAASDARSSGDAGPDAGVSSDAGTLMPVYVTFYGWADNSPPGNAIAYPKNAGFATPHSGAGGTGTYADPITFATDKAEFPAGTILYVPFIEKYVVMEDDCGQCDTDWATAHKWHIDVWMNSTGAESSTALIGCEGQWTRSSTNVEVGPPPDRTVTTRPLFDPATNVCRTSP